MLLYTWFISPSWCINFAFWKFSSFIWRWSWSMCSLYEWKHRTSRPTEVKLASVGSNCWLMLDTFMHCRAVEDQGWHLVVVGPIFYPSFSLYNYYYVFMDVNFYFLIKWHRWSKTVSWDSCWRCKPSSPCWSPTSNTRCICDGWRPWWSSNCKCSKWFTCPVWTWKWPSYSLFGQNVKTSVAWNHGWVEG